MKCNECGLDHGFGTHAEWDRRFDKRDSSADLLELAASWCDGAAKSETSDAVAGLWRTRAKMLRDGYQPLLTRAALTASAVGDGVMLPAACPFDARKFLEGKTGVDFIRGWSDMIEKLRGHAPSATSDVLPGLKAALEIAERYLPTNDAVRFLRNDIKDAIFEASPTARGDKQP